MLLSFQAMSGERKRPAPTGSFTDAESKRATFD